MMRKLRFAGRTAWWAGILTGFVVVLGAAVPASAHRLERRFSVELRPVVTIRNFHGRIQVKSWQKPEVLVIANHASEKTEVDAMQAGNRVDIITHHLTENISPRELEANYEITVPEETELQVRTDSGFVIVERVAGDMTIDTVAADVNLTEVSGYLVIKTVGGSLVCLRCAGRIDFNSIAGNFDMTDPIAGMVRAQTSSGRIGFNGDFIHGGVYVLKTYSGPIDVRISESDSFELSATSINGKVDSPLKFRPPSHERKPSAGRFSNSLFGTYNEGLARVELISFSGTIRIAKRE